jgi:hypothetical protein
VVVGLVSFFVAGAAAAGTPLTFCVSLAFFVVAAAASAAFCNITSSSTSSWSRKSA